MEDLITIIVPVYNVEKYLEESIRSIINQTYKNIEILAINDGSTDGSLELLKKLSYEDDRIKIISQKNKGLSGARNTGIDSAKGNYIMFLDSDDIFSTNELLESLYKIARKDSSDIVFFKYKTKNEITKREKILEINLSKESYILSEFLKEIAEKNRCYYGFISACTKLYKKDIFFKLRFKEGIYYEDTEIFLRLLLEAKKISFLNQVGIEYRVGRVGSITTSTRKIDDMLKVGIFIEEFHKELQEKDQKKIESLVNMILNNLYFVYFFSIRKLLLDETNNIIEKKIGLYETQLKNSIIKNKLFLKNVIVMKSIKLLGIKNNSKIFRLVFK